MNTMTGTVSMNAVLTMLNSLSRHDRRWLVEQLSAQEEREHAEANKAMHEILTSCLTWEERDNALLDATLARISGDWGGDGSPTEIAKELRQGPEMIRKVGSW